MNKTLCAIGATLVMLTGVSILGFFLWWDYRATWWVIFSAVAAVAVGVVVHVIWSALYQGCCSYWEKKG